MTETTPSTTARPALPWLLIVGLASLSLLWPLTNLIGIGQGAPRALTIIAVVAVTWIAVVGFGRVPRPVLVLTLTGLAHGAISMVVAAIFGGVDGPVWTVFVALVIDTFWGAIAGLLALAIQQMRKPRA
ncbi:hypothetical protein [Microbacterium murale]|uniref:Uncharacterized protein n=1 Tax=Microbacterium murale TaxID=1081040 RepID=A0ABU0P8N3_9MICO|nr:hypothetical protein [Microbacterium murale]MDQ0643699.1 hypothetical protein [Microbacterium murale]